MNLHRRPHLGGVRRHRVHPRFILDVFAQKIVAWNAAPTLAVELVDVPLRMALWQGNREGRPVVRGELIGHADAGSQGGFNRWM